MWIVPFDGLTQDQTRAVLAAPDQHRILRGAPGSGKTLVIAHRARHLMDTYPAFRDRTRVFVFTRTLKAYIKSGLRDLGINEDSVDTYDAWCMEQYRRFVAKTLPRRSEKKSDYDYDAIRAGVHDAARRGLLDGCLGAVLVDEGQDLDAAAFEVLRRAARHVTVAFDANQRIYARGASLDDVAGCLGVSARGITFISTFRCSPYIARIAAEFVDTEYREAFLRQVAAEQSEREKPLVYFGRGLDDEKQRLAAVIRERQQTDRSIAILVPKKSQVYGLGKGLNELGVEVEVQQSGWRHSDHDINFSSELPKLLTYHSAKGLTFDTVLLPRLCTGSFERQDAPERLLFVGITRATKWLYIGTDDGGRMPLFAKFRALQARGDMHFQAAGDGASARPKDAVRDESVDDFF